MIAAGRGGQIVNVSSAAGLFGLPWHAPYSATKFGLRGVSEVLRFDLRRHRIGVTLVCPGAVRTPLAGTVDDRRRRPRAARHQQADRALRAPRRQSPEHVAACILDGVERNRYMVFTRPTSARGSGCRASSPGPTSWAMRRLQRRFGKVVRATR